MRRVPPPAAALLVLGCAFITATPGRSAPAPARAAGFVPGRVLVRMAPGRLPSSLRPLGFPVALLEGGNRPGLSPAHVSPGGPGESLSRTWRLEAGPGVDIVQLTTSLAAQPGVEFAAPVHLLSLLSLPEDPEIGNQWQHVATGAPAAWDISAADSSVVIAIVDTGIDLTHPDLRPALWTNRAEEAGVAGVDDDGNGYVDDLHGYDFTDVPEILGSGDYAGRDADPSDDVGHGTWVAGASAAAGNNHLDGAGTAWRARIMPLRAGFKPRSGFSLGFLAEDDAAAAIIYAADNGADVLNLSFGDVVRAPVLEEAVRYAIDRGVIVLAAAGNSSDDSPFYPAGQAGVLAVGASSREGGRASFSTWGPAVQLMAPGASILTTELGGGMGSKSGTSLASPVAAGAAAILRSVHPGWTAGQVLQALVSSAADPASPAQAHGGRLLRIDRALLETGAASIDLLEPVDGGAVDHSLVVRGSAYGAGVRGWRVLVRRDSEAWRTIGQVTDQSAVADTLASWATGQEPEGPMTLRVEALGLDRVLAWRESRVTIDHTDPVIDAVEYRPVLSGTGYGLRIRAESDEPVLGSMDLAESSGRTLHAESSLFAEAPVMGFDGPLAPGPVDISLAFRDQAGRTTRAARRIEIPAPSSPPRMDRPLAPVASTWLPKLVDLNGDGTTDLIGESLDRNGSFYGEIIAWSWNGRTDDGEPVFNEMWRSGARGIPTDVGDFDGDGRLDLLSLGLREISIYSPMAAGGFPTREVVRSQDAWPARFIPSPDGPGMDVVGSREESVYIFRRNQAGGIEVRQALANPTTGENAITPRIVGLDADGDGRISLATIDAGGELLLWTRNDQGIFAFRQAVATGSSDLELLAAGDLDGDGRSEIAVVESVTDVPSPSVGLKDGFYRLVVYHFSSEGELVPTLLDGAIGQFPSNPVWLDMYDSDGDGRAEIWWGITGRLYRLRLNDAGGLVQEGTWTGIGDGSPAVGPLVTVGSSRPSAIVLPAWQEPGHEVTSSPILVPMGGHQAIPAAGLQASIVGQSAGAGDTLQVKLSWSGPAGASFTVFRNWVGGPQSPDRVWGPTTELSLIDSTLLAGSRQRYRVIPEEGDSAEAPDLLVRGQAGNPITALELGGRVLSVSWRDPVRASERARLHLDPPDQPVESSLITRDGRNVSVTFAAPLHPGRAYSFRLEGYVSDSGLELLGEDARAEFVGPTPPRSLRLLRARAEDATTLRLDFDPAAPLAWTAGDFLLDPATTVLSAERVDDTSLRLRLAAPLGSGDRTIRLAPGLVGPGGEVVRPGEGDAAPLRLLAVLYPNPVRAGTDRMTADWIPPGTRVHVVTMTGIEVWTGVADEGGRMTWDLRNSAGERVGPGVYLFVINGIKREIQKIAVLR